MLAKNQSEWRQLVLKRDNFTCQRCGTEDKVIAHHIKNQYTYPELILEVDNGKTYCRVCHHFVHRNIDGIQLTMFYYRYHSWLNPPDRWIFELNRPNYGSAVKNSIKRSKIRELEEAGLVPVGLL